MKNGAEAGLEVSFHLSSNYNADLILTSSSISSNYHIDNLVECANNKPICTFAFSATWEIKQISNACDMITNQLKCMCNLIIYLKSCITTKGNSMLKMSGNLSFKNFKDIFKLNLRSKGLLPLATGDFETGRMDTERSVQEPLK